MRLVLQRVAHARVEVDGERVGAIGPGLLVLAGVAAGDDSETVRLAAERLLTLRLFADTAGRMNLDLRQVGGRVLLVSQFTLVASLDRGRRPSFDRAAPPEEARQRLAELAAHLAAAGVPVEQGRFGAHMAVKLVNDGPVTFVLDL